MAAQAAYDRRSLLLQRGEVMRVIGVAVACQRELLPNENAPAVAVFEEAVFVDDASAPRTQDVEIGCYGNVYQFFAALFPDCAGEKFGADPVGAFGEDSAAVQFDLRRGGAPRFRETLGFAPCPFVHYEPYPAEADLLFHAFEFLALCVEQAVARSV